MARDLRIRAGVTFAWINRVFESGMAVQDIVYRGGTHAPKALPSRMGRWRGLSTLRYLLTSVFDVHLEQQKRLINAVPVTCGRHKDPHKFSALPEGWASLVCATLN